MYLDDPGNQQGEKAKEPHSPTLTKPFAGQTPGPIDKPMLLSQTSPPSLRTTSPGLPVADSTPAHRPKPLRTPSMQSYLSQPSQQGH
ncbi:uncharacterized, partial [Tachysurus ichikawai]